MNQSPNNTSSPSNGMGTHAVLALLNEASKRTINQEALYAQRILSSQGEPTPSLRALEAMVFESFNAVSTHVSPDHEDFELHRWVYIVREHYGYLRLFGDCLEALTDMIEQRGLLPNLRV